MIKFEKIKAGDTLYDVHSYRMGNTTITTMGCWTVYVFEVDSTGRRALVSWNGNRKEWWSEVWLKRLRAKKPEFETGLLGQKRIKRKERAR